MDAHARSDTLRSQNGHRSNPFCFFRGAHRHSGPPRLPTPTRREAPRACPCLCGIQGLLAWARDAESALEAATLGRDQVATLRFSAFAGANGPPPSPLPALLNRLQRRTPSLRSSGPALLLARYLPYLPVPAVPANKGIQLPPPSPARPRGVAVHGQASSPCPSSSLIPSTCRPPRAQPPGQRAREPLALASSAASTRPERRATQRRRGPPTTWQREAVLWLFRWSSTHTKLGSPSSQAGLRGLGRSGTCPYLAVPVWCAAV